LGEFELENKNYNDERSIYTGEYNNKIIRKIDENIEK